ncbi:MAG TPA: cytidylate kinase [Sediminispirochaeta sp.]|nr:cytidylate kinase [Sediminispirochaeta sp.]
MSNKIKPGIKIAISGKSGCGNSSVSRLVADKLNLRLINYTFKDMAAERDMDFEEFCRLAESDHSYDIELDNKQVKLAEGGDCVLGSRLAIWVLKDADLKVFLEASLDTRAERIVQREGGSLAEQREATRARDVRDNARYKKLYGIDNDDYGFADLKIRTDDKDQYEIADLIIEAAKSIS